MSAMKPFRGGAWSAWNVSRAPQKFPLLDDTWESTFNSKTSRFVIFTTHKYNKTQDCLQFNEVDERCLSTLFSAFFSVLAFLEINDDGWCWKISFPPFCLAVASFCTRISVSLSFRVFHHVAMAVYDTKTANACFKGKKYLHRFSSLLSALGLLTAKTLNLRAFAVNASSIGEEWTERPEGEEKTRINLREKEKHQKLPLNKSLTAIYFIPASVSSASQSLKAEKKHAKYIFNVRSEAEVRARGMRHDLWDFDGFSWSFLRILRGFWRQMGLRQSFRHSLKSNFLHFQVLTQNWALCSDDFPLAARNITSAIGTCGSEARDNEKLFVSTFTAL